MKYIFIILGLFFAQLSFGQLKGAIPQSEVPEDLKKEKMVAPSTPEGVAKENAEKLTKSLKLNQKQSADLQVALLDYETNVNKINKSKLTNKEKYLKINEQNRTRQSKLKAILTKEQYNTYIMSFP